jgi:hypothetical protein
MIGRAGRSHLLIVATSVVSLASETAAQGTCNLLGEVFVTNPFDQTLVIKGDGSADINTIRFSDQTQFVQVTVERKPAGGFDPKNLQTGDRLCVQLATAPAKTADRVLVMKRLDIQEHQKQVFSALARNSAFGVVTDLNAGNRTIRMNEEIGGGASQQVTVDASDPVAFRYYSSAAQVGKEGVAGAWNRLQVGDSIYVQGWRDVRLPTIRAGVIIEGGVRGIVGTIISMNGLGEVLELRQFGSGNSMAVRTSRNAVFRASPFVEAAIIRERPGSSASWDLYPISFSDLQKGDTISVLAREQEGMQNALIGLMVVTGFGSYGINALPSGAPAFWFLDPLKAAR